MMLNAALSSYPIDMSSFLILRHCAFDATGAWLFKSSSHSLPQREKKRIWGHPKPRLGAAAPNNSTFGYHPTTIAQYALAHWNQYLTTDAENHRKAFLTQANWLIEHESRIDDDAGGWPISFPHPDIHLEGSWLSALTQGNAISVLVRAYQLTQEEAFLEVVRRAIRTFERDILDGGVSTPVGEEGIFFEEVAIYPTAHILSGFIFALFGLYDYVALTNDVQIEMLIQRGLAAMHSLLDEFDAGFWTRHDLHHRHLASSSHLALQVELLEALVTYSGCEHCSRLAIRWKSYQCQFGSRLRYLVSSRCAFYSRALWSRVQKALFPKLPQPQTSQRLRVCVSIPSFPVTGGVLTVLEGIAQVTEDIWQREYLTQYIGPQHPENFVIHRFGTAKMLPWLFPVVWLYFLAGSRKLASILHSGAGYHIILPQDAIFTGAFSALTAKLAGVRVVCVDHGDLTLLDNRSYHAELMGVLARKNWHWALRLLAQRLLMLYWPSRHLQVRIAARFIDHFLIPGIAGDGIEEVCKQLGVPQSRITRFASMIDVQRHVVPDVASRARMRAQKDLAADAIVVAIICRLAPEKGLDVAVESIRHALSALSPDLRVRVRVIFAGDGPLRKYIEEEIRVHGLSENCLLWGDISAQEVISLLGLSDIFLYTSVRGACFPMAVLEAMASSCAVIASTQPMSNAHLLAEERGIAVAPGDVAQTSAALTRLVSDLELCRRMGKLARDYIAVHHSPAMFRRTLMRATYWSALDEFLDSGKESVSALKIGNGS